MSHDTLIQLAEITGEHRFGFTTELFGQRACLEGELAVFQWMRRLCSTYDGGYWNFYRLSNGGFFMAPNETEPMRLVWAMNWSDELVSAQVAGIVATLFALYQTMQTHPDDLLVENYHLLREFLSEHPEAEAMFRLID